MRTAADSSAPPAPPLPLSTPPPTDAALLAELVAGSKSAFDLFVERFYPRLSRFIGSRIRDPHLIEDLVQEVFLRLFRSACRANYAGRSSVTTWLFGIANNVMIDHFRFNNRRPLILESDLPEESRPPDPMKIETTPLDQAITQEHCSELQKHLDALPEEQHQVVTLKLYAELTFAEIAELLGISASTTKSRFLYAIQKLQTAFHVDANRRHS